MPTGLPAFQLTLTAPGSGLVNSERGWALFDSMQESYGRGDYTWQSWGDVSWGSAPANFADYSSMIFIPEINALICRPYPHQYESDAIDIDYWGTVGAGGTDWEEQTGTGVFGMYNSWYVQNNSNLTTENGLYFGYSLPPNPCFEVIVGRYQPSCDWQMAGQDAWSRIVWAGGRFELLIPWNRPASLFDQARNLLMEIPVNLHEGDMQFFSVRVMHLRGRVLISSDRGKSWFVYGVGDKAENSIITQAGTIQVTNLGSAWSFNFIPIDFPTIGRFYSKSFDKGYTPTNSVTGAGASMIPCDYMYNYWSGYTTPSITIEEVDLGDTRYCEYVATLTPSRYTIGPATFAHTPELYSVRLQNKPVTEQGPTGTPDTLAVGDILEIEITNDEAMELSTCRLRLNNYQGQSYEDLREYGIIDLNLKAHDSDDYYNAFDGFIYQVEPEHSTEGKYVILQCVGRWLNFEDIKCYECDPVFAGREIGDVIEWAALRCGISYDKETYGSDTCLTNGLGGTRICQPDAGRSWGDFLKWVAAYEQKNLYFDGTALKYESEPDENTITWHFKCATTQAGAPESAIPIINFINAPRDPSDHRNDIRIMGRDVDGNPLPTVKRDQSNIDAIGHEKTLYIQDPAYDTQERVNLVTSTLYNNLSPYPPRRVNFRIRGRADVKRRDIIKIWGGKAKVDEQVFRITRTVHRWNQESNPQFITEVEAIWLRDDS